MDTILSSKWAVWVDKNYSVEGPYSLQVNGILWPIIAILDLTTNLG